MSSKTLGKKTSLPTKPNPLFSFSLGVLKAASGTVLGITMIGSAIVAGGLVGLAISFRNLPDVRVLRNYAPSETNYIYDVKGRLLTSLHGEANREILTLEQISPELKRAVIAVEDSDFYQHRGINPYSIGRAVWANYQKGGVSEGASTITMQLVKNLFLTTERTLTRKLAEAILAIRVEQVFTKDEILEMYLNNIYWGHNNYGVQTAAETYFNKSAAELNLSEAAMMAGLIQAPEQYSPFLNYEATKRRQGAVIERMGVLGWITAEEVAKTKKEPLLLGKPTAWRTSKLPFITEAVVAELEERFSREKVLQGGMRVQTTIDLYFQKMAEKSVKDSHKRLLGQGLRADQIALAAVDPRTHFVKALVGGVSHDQSQFNRAMKSRRQPGSSFKPFAYYVAFASGKYTPDTAINDAPVKYRVPSGWYRPQNYGGKKDFAGKMSLRASLIQSRNIPAVKIGRSVGLERIIEICRALGIKSPLQPVISLPLGSIGVTPLEMAGAYATFASNGWHSDPTLILQVGDSKGNVLLDNQPKPQQILDPWATANLTSVLKGVIAEGTGKNANIGRTAAGKTGTTSSERDIWFVGYVPQLATAVWVGNDDYKSIGKGVTGGVHAAPVWRSFMLKALEDKPVKYFPAPSKFPRP
ncbi:Penicillin-binding protein, 1A family [Hyella patelloides LEGE 07179]|uniref:Penicillin-binding protein, 1A family n=1 Tax=Hyella patelloides LEGE 07179 TaxID=945734 RepID=A0A563VVJ1_9CYAN|nr:penicillin-binding protein 1A [Hyella patelloides]VEP15293.1 Penicillin-binding protein, 1A family [Hyella patelloides LEGE 07179]